MRRILGNNSGFFIPALIFATVAAVGTWLYLSGTTGQRIRNTSGRALQQVLDNPDNVPNEVLDQATQHSQNVATFAQIMHGTGSIVNGATPTGPPGGTIEDAVAAVIQTGQDRAIDYGLSEDRRPPATSSNPLPTNVSPPPSCSSTGLSGCTSRNSCQSAGGTWQPDNRCSTTPVPSCRRNNLSGCTSQSACENVGGYWYNGACHAAPPPERCDNAHLHLCTTKADCTNAGGFWYDDHCNASPEACWTDVTQCRTRAECEAAAGYWYNEGCHVQSQCADGGGVCTCENGQEICCAQVCDGVSQCSDGSDEWTCDCDETGIRVCANGKKICANKACNGRDDCGDGSDEQGCGNQDSCCVQTRGCPGETATSCAETCCCCPYGQVCDPVNWWNGCIWVGY